MTSSMERLRIGGYQPERSVHTRAVRGLEHELASSGAFRIEVTPEIMKTGRPAADLLAMTEAGELDICYFASSYLAGRVPALTLLDLPFPGTDRAAIWLRLDGKAGRQLQAEVERQTGYELLGFWDNGIRHISNAIRPIRAPADCAGLSIRTLDNAFHQALFGALGFRPRFIDVKDLALEVRQRTIDAQENPLTNIVNFAIHEAHRHVTLLGQFFGIALLLGNRARLAQLSPDRRRTLDMAIATATACQRGYAAEEDTTCLATIEAAGCAVVHPAEIDLAGFRQAVASVAEREVAGLDQALLATWQAG